jgi:hypothetical protein
VALVSLSRDKVDVPHEPGEWLELQSLSGDALDAARRAKVKSSMSLMEGLDAERIKAMEAVHGSAAEVKPHPRDQYDHTTLLRRSITSWSYSDTVDVLDLDIKTSKWAIEVILDRNGLLEDEVERKNG